MIKKSDMRRHRKIESVYHFSQIGYPEFDPLEFKATKPPPFYTTRYKKLPEYRGTILDMAFHTISAIIVLVLIYTVDG